MTNEEAVKKALEEWPAYGYAKFMDGRTSSVLKPYQVGEWKMFGVIGSGDSWEEAFEQAAIKNQVKIDPEKVS